MRSRVWLLLVAVVVGLVSGFLGRGTDLDSFNVVAGFAWLTAIGLGISLLPFWNRVVPPVPPMPGLFDAVPEGERWCVHCGSPTQQEGPCSVCRAAGPDARKA